MTACTEISTRNCHIMNIIRIFLLFLLGQIVRKMEMTNQGGNLLNVWDLTICCGDVLFVPRRLDEKIMGLQIFREGSETKSIVIFMAPKYLCTCKYTGVFVFAFV